MWKVGLSCTAAPGRRNTNRFFFFPVREFLPLAEGLETETSRIKKSRRCSVLFYYRLFQCDSVEEADDEVVGYMGNVKVIWIKDMLQNWCRIQDGIGV